MAVTSAVAAFLLRQFGWRGLPVFASVSFIAILSFSLPYMRELIGLISSVAASQSLLDSATAAIKIIGVGYLSGITADVCRELELPGAASAVMLVGRIEIIAIVSPFFYEIIRMGRELIL